MYLVTWVVGMVRVFSANGSAVVKNLTFTLRRLWLQSFYSCTEHVDEPAFIPFLHFRISKSVFNGIFYHHLQSMNALLLSVFYASSGIVMCFSGGRVSFAKFLLIIEVFYWLLLFALELVFNLKQVFCCFSFFFSLWWTKKLLNDACCGPKAPTYQTDNHS